MSLGVQYSLCIIVLIIFSGIFSAVETAYSSASKIRLRNIESDGNKKAGKVLAILEDYESFLITILIGNNIVNIGAATIGTLLFTLYFQEQGPTLSTIFLTIVVLLLGEITPKSIAKQIPERFAITTVSFVGFMLMILRPVVWIVGGWQFVVGKLINIEEEDSDIADELITMVDEAEKEGDLDAHESDLISAAIEFNDLDVGDILTPRVDIIAIDIGTPIDKIEEIFRMNSYSRLPVFETTIDTIVGVIHQKDFYDLMYHNKGSIKKIIKPVIYTSPNTKISTLLKQLQSAKLHMAVVLDEYGGTDGLITVEDIIEELVGEIWDEHDIVEEFYTKIDDHTYLVQCDAEIDDLFERFNIDVDDDDYDYITVSGWVINELGHIPSQGESFDFQNLHVTVTKALERKVVEVKIEVKQEMEKDD